MSCNPGAKVRPSDTIAWWDWGIPGEKEKFAYSGQRKPDEDIRVVLASCNCIALFEETHVGIPRAISHIACRNYPRCSWSAKAALEIAQLVIDGDAVPPKVKTGKEAVKNDAERPNSCAPVRVRHL